MAAPIDRTGNFRDNFCSKPLDDKELVLFNTDECRIRKRDRFNSVFQGAVLSQAERGQKFDTLWELRQQNWSRLSDDEKRTCDRNLEHLSGGLFNVKKAEERRRETTFNLYNFEIKGASPFLLKNIEEGLIQYGRVGVDRNRNLVEHDRLNDGDEVLEFRYFPDADGRHGDIDVLVPRNWSMGNARGHYFGRPGAPKELCRFMNGENWFQYDRGPAFSLTVSHRGLPNPAHMARPFTTPRGPMIPPSSSSSSSSSSAVSWQPEPPPSSSSSSSSSSSAVPIGPVISDYEEMNGNDDPVPPEFLVTLTSGGHKDYFHRYSLTAAMLAQDAPINPMNREPVPPGTLREMAQKMHVDPQQFMGIWKAAESAFPNQYQYDARRERRFELFRAMINSDEGSAGERMERSKTRSQIAKRGDWQVLLEKPR